MRTTVDLPDDVHELLRYLAAGRQESMSATLTAIVKGALGSVDDHDHRRVQRDTTSGLLIAIGGPTRTAADVARLASEE